MNVDIQTLKFDADQKLIDFVEAKVNKMDKFEDSITSVGVILRLEKDNEHGNKVAAISIEVPGDKFVAEKQCKTFEEAVDLSIDALKKQLSKYKKPNK